MWEKVNLMSSIPAVKTTTRPISAGRNFVSLSFLVNGQYFKDYLKILGTLGLDHGSFTQWIHIVKWIVPFVKRIADWSVQKARTEAVRRGEKNPVRRLLSDSQPLQLRRYLPRCEDWQNYIAYFAYGCTLEPWLTMLRHQAAENSAITSGAAKKVLFSSRDNCNCLILKQFERTSYFLGIQAWVLRQNWKQKKYAQKSGHRSTFSFLISLFFIISQNACLNFFETAFELLLYRKYGKRV